MRVTANQLTILRIISLPIPCVLLYGGLGSKVAALFIFAFLGFTDYLDGVLARRHGTTPFGTLFDPIADKIFITVVYIPFVQLGYIPLWTAFLLFLREFLITELRRVLSQRQLELRVTKLAKSKTTIQMAGAAFILLAYLISNKPLCITLFSIPLAVTLVIFVWNLIRRRDISQRIVLALCGLSYILLIRLFFSPGWSAFLYMVIIIGVTYASAFQYLMVSRSVWPEIEGYPIRLFFRLIGGFLIPMLAVVMLCIVPDASWMVICILSLEFASQGLDTWISSLGEQERTKERLKHLVMVPSTVGAAVVFPILADVQVMATAFLWISLCLSAAYMATDFYGHRKLFVAQKISR